MCKSDFVSIVSPSMNNSIISGAIMKLDKRLMRESKYLDNILANLVFDKIYSSIFRANGYAIIKN